MAVILRQMARSLEVQPGIAKQPVKEHVVQAAQATGRLVFDVVKTELATLAGVDLRGDMAGNACVIFIENPLSS